MAIKTKMDLCIYAYGDGDDIVDSRLDMLRVALIPRYQIVNIDDL